MEDYHNAGMTSEQTKKAIEGIYDPAMPTARLRCQPMGVNGNWIVRTFLRDSVQIAMLVEDIRYTLELSLNAGDTSQITSSRISAAGCD